MNISKKVEQLKKSFTVEGTPLFKSNHFTDEEIEKMKKESTCHESHWCGLEKPDKSWSDDEIATQIEVFFNTPNLDTIAFKKLVNKMLKSLPIINKNHELKVFTELLFGCLNWTNEKNGISEMWVKFGSAPIDSMEIIFGGQFENKFHIFWYGVKRAIFEFDNYWDNEKRKKDLKEKTFSSPYNSVDEIEENVVIKNVAEVAKQFYHDKTKDFEERVKVFTKYAKRNTFIFHPTDHDLDKIFKIYIENDFLERRQIIECEKVVNSWIESLMYKRCHLSWTNPYHPTLKQKNRNYKPSEKAIDRLYKYYMEKLFNDEVGSYEFDW